MLSKSKIKLIQSLDSKKNRLTTGLFIVEGDKMVEEVLSSEFTIELLLATNNWYSKHSANKFKDRCECEIVSEEELKKCSFLKSPPQAICLVKAPNYNIEDATFKNKLTIILDTIQDPGNLGTIIRIADWFGIDQIICSEQTADAYNPKVIQSTMGAIFRMKIFYQPLLTILKTLKDQQIQVYGTTLDGENIYKSTLSAEGCIIMGNESKGIDPALIPFISKKLFIPFYPPEQQHSESLNVSVATGIICAEFRRLQTII